MRLVLHIGTPKTATTYLQNTLGNNPRWLSELGICYPNMLTGDRHNHMTLMFAAALRIGPFARQYGIKTERDRLAFREKLSAHIKSAVDKAPSSIVDFVCSSENLTGNMARAGVFSLRDMLKPIFDEIKVVCYIRRQDDAVLSMYAEHMRKGFSAGPFEDFIERCEKNKNFLGYTNYDELISNWADAFGRDSVRVRRFEKNSFVGGGGILTDFVSEVKGRPIEKPLGLFETNIHNASLSAPVLAYLSILNQNFPFERDGVPCGKRLMIEKTLNMLPATEKPIMSFEQSERIMANYAVSNAEVLRKWFSGENELFGNSNSVSENPNLGRISVKESVNFTSIVLNSIIKN